MEEGEGGREGEGYREEERDVEGERIYERRKERKWKEKESGGRRDGNMLEKDVKGEREEEEIEGTEMWRIRGRGGKATTYSEMIAALRTGCRMHQEWRLI